MSVKGYILSINKKKNETNNLLNVIPRGIKNKLILHFSFLGN